MELLALGQIYLLPLLERVSSVKVSFFAGNTFIIATGNSCKMIFWRDKWCWDMTFALQILYLFMCRMIMALLEYNREGTNSALGFSYR